MNYNVSYANQAYEFYVASFMYLFDAKTFIKNKVKCYKKVLILIVMEDTL